MRFKCFHYNPSRALMKIALYSRDGRAMSDGRLSRMFGKLEKESFDFYEISGGEDILPETDLVMSVGRSAWDSLGSRSSE